MKGYELKELRKDHGLTLLKLSVLTHYTVPYLCYSESLDSELSPKLNKMIELIFKDKKEEVKQT